eukprot:Gb_30136 [translate_table: standard]
MHAGAKASEVWYSLTSMLDEMESHPTCPTFFGSTGLLHLVKDEDCSTGLGRSYLCEVTEGLVYLKRREYFMKLICQTLPKLTWLPFGPSFEDHTSHNMAYLHQVLEQLDQSRSTLKTKDSCPPPITSSEVISKSIRERELQTLEKLVPSLDNDEGKGGKSPRSREFHGRYLLPNPIREPLRLLGSYRFLGRQTLIIYLERCLGACMASRRNEDRASISQSGHIVETLGFPEPSVHGLIWRHDRSGSRKKGHEIDSKEEARRVERDVIIQRLYQGCEGTEVWSRCNDFIINRMTHEGAKWAARILARRLICSKANDRIPFLYAFYSGSDLHGALGSPNWVNPISQPRLNLYSRLRTRKEERDREAFRYLGNSYTTLHHLNDGPDKGNRLPEYIKKQWREEPYGLPWSPPYLPVITFPEAQKWDESSKGKIKLDRKSSSRHPKPKFSVQGQGLGQSRGDRSGGNNASHDTAIDISSPNLFVVSKLGFITFSLEPKSFRDRANIGVA